MKRFFLVFLSLIFAIQDCFASVVIVTLLPNPLGDDTLSEYIELRNTGCSSVDISGYILSDASGKSYSIASMTSIASHATIKFPYSETKISLNNSGDEILHLKDREGNIVDSYSYSGTQKDNIVLEITHTDEVCSDGILGESTGSGAPSTLTGGTSSGNVADTGSTLVVPGSISNTGSVDISSGTVVEYSSGNIIASGSNSLTDSSLDFSGEVIVFTGGSYDSGGLMPESSTGAIVPESSVSSGGLTLTTKWLYYTDTNTNGKIDRLEILYDKSLSGSIAIDQIALYSATGGLYSGKISTETGYIIAASLSGNILMLDIVESMFPKTELKINNTITSELRLKSLGDLGLRSVDGDMIEGFFLTTSFASYKNVSPKMVALPDMISTGAIEEVGSGVTSETGMVETGGVLFPEIYPILQSPSNATFSSGVFLCDEVPCRLNITLAPIFTGAMHMKDYLCSFGSGEISLEFDSDCNPNTFTYSSSGSIVIELLEKRSAGKMRTVYPLIFTGKTLGSSPPLGAYQVSDSGKPVARIQIDGKWKEYYELIGDYEMNCYTITCSLNFTAEDSYDPEGSPIRFLWIYGFNSIKTSRDPGTIKYEFGDHRMILRVVDSAGNFDEIVYSIHVLGPRPKTSVEKKDGAVRSKTPKAISSSVKDAKKKFKKIRMEFFSPPEIALQGKTGKILGPNLYQCSIRTAKTCSMNVTLTGAMSSFDYLWELDGREVFRGKNPPAWKLYPGTHSLILRTFRKGASQISSEQKYRIIVKKIAPKLKKTRVAKKPKKLTNTRTHGIIPVAVAQGSSATTDGGDQSPFVFSILIMGLLFGYVLRGRRKPNHSS